MIKDLKPVFERSECPLGYQIEKFLDIWGGGYNFVENSLRWYLVDLKGGRILGKQAYLALAT
jgi:hypothetical protein